MKIEHVAIYTRDLERLRRFYETYFGAVSNRKYANEDKGFASYFLTFGDGARLEIMEKKSVSSTPGDFRGEYLGYAHLAFSVESESAVDALTRRLENDGHIRLDGPRRTGDGYYESLVLDPDGNRIEITV